MCKYCKFTTQNDDLGEKTNGGVTIGQIKDGSQIFDVCLYRYSIKDANYRETSLIVTLYVDAMGERYDVKEKHIKIKYCPFCGEEL